MPWPHSFGSRVWEYQEEPDPPFGELNGPRVWRGGQAPASAGELPGICGTPEQWANGVTDAGPIPPVYPGTAIPRCCSNKVVHFFGGTATGGNAVKINCPALASWPDGLRVRIDSGMASMGLPDGFEFDMVQILADPPFWGCSGPVFCDTFAETRMLCESTAEGTLSFTFYDGFSSTNIFGQALDPFEFRESPPLARFQFVVTTPTGCGPNVVTLTVYAP